MPTLTTVNAQWTNGTAVSDADLRRMQAGNYLGDGTSLGARGGIVRHGDNSLAVTVNGSDQITIQPGVVVIPSTTALAGAYMGAFGAVTGPGAGTAIASRNSTNPRIDLVIADISAGTARLRTLDGTPSASPVAPALPSGSVELARINVPNIGGGAVTVTTTFRTFATSLGGILYVEAASQLPGSGNQAGQRAVVLSSLIEYQWNGTAWIAQANDAGVTFATNVVTHGDGSRVYRRGSAGFLHLGFQANAGLGANVLLMTVPAGYLPAAGPNSRAVIFNFNTGGFLPVVINSSGQVLNEVAITNGHAFRGTLAYPMA